MAQDIEEFLRMAAARKKQQSQTTQNPPPDSPQRSVEPQSPSVPLGQETGGLTPETDETDGHSHPNLQSSIQTTVSTQDIIEHTSHLGERVHNRTDVVDSRVNKKFDHDLGQLKKSEITAPMVVDHGKGVETTTDISTVLNLIQNPDSLKQAVILKEILDRPKF
ncbi:MAG: hypothetical protein VX438_14895 [Planctomycetota bacterium]|nr:hypothetical protein [Planctomycetota bacterium]